MASKKPPDYRAWSVIAARLLLGALLCYTGFIKISDLHGFSEEISNYKLLPGILQRFVAVVLPWNEVVAGAMLIIGLWTRAVALIATAMFGVFAIAVFSALVRGLDISCGCFGKATVSPLGYQTLAIDAVGLALGLIVFFWTNTKAKKTRKT